MKVDGWTRLETICLNGVNTEITADRVEQKTCCADPINVRLGL